MFVSFHFSRVSK